LNGVAFASNNNSASDVTVKYLTVENFITGNGGDGEAVVNHDLSANWTIEYDTIENNVYGVGIEMGNNDVVEHDCLTNNGETGIQSFGGTSNLTISNNEISYNDSQGLYDQPHSSIQCGCAGGIKLLWVTGATIADNYVHNNGDVGIWADTNNVGIDISGNYVSANYTVGIQYEISYNGQITDNTLVDNALGSGPTNGSVHGNVTGAIYLAQSGSDLRVSSTFGATFSVTGNILINNWDGIIVYDNSGRFCDSQGTTGTCTLDDPSAWNGHATTTCDENQDVAATNDPNYWDLCRWKPMNVQVSNNVLSFNPTAIDALLAPGTAQCSLANFCGLSGLYAFNAGGTLQPSGCSTSGNPAFSCGTSDSVNVSYNWGNSFRDNTYYGPWEFWAFNQGDLDNWPTWTGTLSRCSQAQYACPTGFGQDAGSSYSASGGPYWS
jgi:hypothetical protein